MPTRLIVSAPATGKTNASIDDIHATFENTYLKIWRICSCHFGHTPAPHRSGCQDTGVRLVYVQLSVNWVQETAHWAFEKLHPEVAVLIWETRRDFENYPLRNGQGSQKQWHLKNLRFRH